MLDREAHAWWSARGIDRANAVQIPATAAENERSEALLAFDLDEQEARQPRSAC